MQFPFDSGGKKSYRIPTAVGVCVRWRRRNRKEMLLPLLQGRSLNLTHGWAHWGIRPPLQAQRCKNLRAAVFRIWAKFGSMKRGHDPCQCALVLLERDASTQPPREGPPLQHVQPPRIRIARQQNRKGSAERKIQLLFVYIFLLKARAESETIAVSATTNSRANEAALKEVHITCD